MIQNLALHLKCEEFRKELERLYKIVYESRNCTEEEFSAFWDLLGGDNDDFDFIIASDGKYKSVELRYRIDDMLVFINTEHNTITCYRDGFKEITWLPLEVAYEINGTYEELYLTVTHQN